MSSEDIQMLRDVLGCDEEYARTLLTTAGSVQAAVDLGLGAGGGGLGPPASPARQAVPRQPAAAGGARTPLLAPQAPNPPWRRLGLSLWRLACAVVSAVRKFLASIFASRSLEERLREQYGICPTFFRGTFRAAMASGQARRRLVCVYLHCDTAANTAAFVRDVLCHEAIVALLNSDFVLWVGDILTMEAHEVSRALHVREYPCVYMLLPSTDGAPEVEGQVHGAISVDGLLAQLTHCRDAAADRLEGTATHVRAEQDREYEEALALDRARIAQAEQSQAAEREEATKAQEEERARRARRQALADAWRARVAPQPPTCRIQLRVGSRKQVADFAPTAPVRELSDWTEALEADGVEVPINYALVRNYPVQTLEDMGQTLEAAGLCPSAVVLVRDLDD